MQWIEVHNIQATPDGHNVEMIVAATGKALVLSMAQIKHRNGNLILVDDWLYARLAPCLAPRREDNARANREAGPDALSPGRAVTGRRQAAG